MKISGNINENNVYPKKLNKCQDTAGAAGLMGNRTTRESSGLKTMLRGMGTRVVIRLSDQEMAVLENQSG